MMIHLGGQLIREVTHSLTHSLIVNGSSLIARFCLDVYFHLLRVLRSFLYAVAKAYSEGGAGRLVSRRGRCNVGCGGEFL